MSTPSSPAAVTADDEFNFDLEPVTKPATIRKQSYILTEASEGAACAYRNASMKGVRMDEGKITSLGSMADAQPVLVAGCLFRLDPGSDGGTVRVPVTIQFVKDLPSRVVRPMFDWVKKVSNLEEKTEKKEDNGPKDSPTATTPSSD